MNRKQKNILISVLTIIALSFIAWIIFGGEIFTKTQILIEKKDELFPDMITKEWKDKFIWGLDLTGIISFLSITIGGFFYFRFRDSKTHKNVRKINLSY